MTARCVRAGAASLLLGLGLALTAGAVPVPAGAAARAAFRPVVVERAEAMLEGPEGHGVQGPRAMRATLPQASTPGDLLVVGIVDGVVSSGMTQPRWMLPTGWRRGADRIGGETATDGVGPPRTGGLQASIWYWPDNPGGIRTVRLGAVPRGTVAASTAFVAELSGVPSSLHVAGSGTATSGPSESTDEDRSAVSLGRTLSSTPDLVLAVFANGGTSSDGEHVTWTPGWTAIGDDPDRDGDQPILFDERVWRRRTRPTESERYGETIDNCAVMVALG